VTQLADQPEIQVVAEFLQRCPPFNVLSSADFQRLVSCLEITYFRQGHVFNDQENDGGLRILRSGAVEIRDKNGKLLDRLGEGESFNIASLNKSGSDTRAVLIEDSLIYLLKEHDYQQIRETSREFDRFFHGQRDRRLRRAVRYEATPHQLMTPLTTLMSKDVLMISCEDSVQTSAELMTQRRVSSALIMEEDSLCGIITDRDFRSRVMAQGLPATEPVKSVMTLNPGSIDSQATVFDATLLMTRSGYHHLPVVDDGKVVGIITASDLMLAKQNDPVYLVQHISRQNDVAGLSGVVETLPNLLVEWVGAQTRARQISHIFTAISDAITSRLIELAIEEYGPAPVPFCWLGFGSQARGEQLLGADQDNGLLISNDLKEEDKPWFENLAKFVCDGLNACGYVYCPGKVMATTDEWRQSLTGWRQIVDRWTRSPTPDAVMRVSIFFDLRTIYGDESLCQQLQQYMLEKTSKNSIFLAALAANVLEHTPPIGIFRRFLVERNGEHRDTLDLKKRGVMPIIDMVRIHALANRISQVNTHERIAELVRQKVLAIADGRNLQDAFDYLMQLRVGEQVKQLTHGEKVSNHYNPNNLPELGRKHLRDAFTVIHDSQEALRLNYRRGL
jgi:CBS domain-containing protein